MALVGEPGFLRDQGEWLIAPAHQSFGPFEQWSRNPLSISPTMVRAIREISRSSTLGRTSKGTAPPRTRSPTKFWKVSGLCRICIIRTGPARSILRVSPAGRERDLPAVHRSVHPSPVAFHRAGDIGESIDNRMTVALPCCVAGVTADNIRRDQPPGPRRLDAKPGKAPNRVVVADVLGASPSGLASNWLDHESPPLANMSGLNHDTQPAAPRKAWATSRMLGLPSVRKFLDGCLGRTASGIKSGSRRRD
jgi:hypothetical protein